MSSKNLIAGRYELGDLIGRGGMGDVYRGTDIYTNQPVAIKWLHTIVVDDNPNLLDRFRREGEALSRLDHPNIVNMLNTVDEDNQHYLIMEYVSGGSLRDLLDREEQLPVERVLNIALDLADALTRAHRLNIVHRDIKPDNVLLAEDGTPRLTDFGVAHIHDRTRLTQTGSVIGTYAYLSPEACNGLDLDERTDIWSFGVMLYEMLAGRLPFDETSTAAILTAILTKPAPDLARLRPELSPDLVDLISRMLEKDRERRLSSVRLVGAEIETMIRSMRELESNGDQAESRFATPSSDQGSVPAMERSIPGQTHGLLLYPAPLDSEEIKSTADLIPAPRLAKRWQWIALTVGILAITCAAIVITAIIFAPEAQEIARDKTATRGALVDASAVEPVAPGEYMVLVAQFEQFGPETRSVTRFIVDDLRQTLEISVPFSQIRIREYPDVVTSSDEALAAADANGAVVVVWGNYTPNEIQAEVQIGSMESFKYMPFDRVVLERTANVRVQLSDERRQSLAMYVLSVLGTLHNADGNGYETMRTMAISEQVDVASGKVVGNTVASITHRRFQAGLDNPVQTLEQIDAAIALDAGNPLLYTDRCIVNQQLGRVADARQDAETAKRLGPPDWTMPLLLMANTSQDWTEVTTLFNQAVNLRPDDWFPLFFRGAIYYEAGELDLARADLERAIALDPNVNFPYIYASILAMREGRIAEAGTIVRTILDEFPDPSYLNRLVTATFGEGAMTPYGAMLSGFGNLVLGRYREVVEVTSAAVLHYDYSTDLFAMRGLGFCGLENYPAAERSYNESIERDPEFMLVYLLRAEVRLKQDDTAGADADFTMIEDSAQAADLAPAIEAVKSGQLECTTFFTEDNPLLWREGR